MYRRLAFVFFVNLLATYGMWYLTYRRYDLIWAPDDSAHYLDLCQHLWDREPPKLESGEPMPIYATRPLRYRVLTPMLVQAMRRTGLHRLYDPGTFRPLIDEERFAVKGAAREPYPEYREMLYYFTLVDYLWLVGASALACYYAYAAFAVPWYLAHAGSLAFLTGFWQLVQSYAPHSDAGAYFLIFLGAVAYERRSWPALVVAGVLGVMQKETTLLVLGILLALEGLRGSRRAWLWGLALVPGLLFYLAMTRYWPAPGHDRFYTAADWWANLVRIFDWHTYDKNFVLPHFLANLPILAALVAHLALLLSGRRVGYPPVLLLMFPLLFAISMALKVNVGRVVALGAVVYLVYEMKVVDALLGWITAIHRSPETPARSERT